MTNPFPDLSIAALFSLIWRKRKFLIILALVTIVLSSIATLFMTEYYRSTVVIFPARTSSLSLNESSVRRGNISDFGEEEEAEQLLQIMNSEALREKVIAKNNLFVHYKIDPEDKYARSKIRQKYVSNVTTKRTKYNSIDISVMDIDPIIAAKIANSISEYIDSVKNRMISERASTSMNMLNSEFDRLKSDLDEVSAQLDTMQSEGVLGAIERGSLYEAFGESMRNANRAITDELKTQIELNKKSGDEYDKLKKESEILTDQILRFKNYQNQFIADAGINIPQKFVVDRAVPADKKSYPVRWLVVLGSLFAVILFSVILLAIQENQSLRTN